MRAKLALALAALWCGVAAAQDGAAVCRSFCDVDAKKCRQESDQDVRKEHSPWLPLTAGGRAAATGSWDFGNEKSELDARRADDERFKGSQACSQARQACRQKCVPPPAAAAASAVP